MAGLAVAGHAFLQVRPGSAPRVGGAARRLACAVGARLDGQPYRLPEKEGAFGEGSAASGAFLEAIGGGLPVVVDFTSPGCGPCQAMGRVLDSMQQEFEGKIQVLKLRVDENSDLAGGFGVDRVPTVLLFSSGSINPVHRFIGAAAEKKVRRRIVQKLLS